MAGLSLDKVLPEFPDIQIDKVNGLESHELLREKGVRKFPTLMHEDRLWSVIFMTRGRIRRFLKGVVGAT